MAPPPWTNKAQLKWFQDKIPHYLKAKSNGKTSSWIEGTQADFFVIWKDQESEVEAPSTPKKSKKKKISKPVKELETLAHAEWVQLRKGVSNLYLNETKQETHLSIANSELVLQP